MHGYQILSSIKLDDLASVITILTDFWIENSKVVFRRDQIYSFLPGRDETWLMLYLKPLQVIPLHNTIVNIAVHAAVRIHGECRRHKTAQRRRFR